MQADTLSYLSDRGALPNEKQVNDSQILFHSVSQQLRQWGDVNRLVRRMRSKCKGVRMGDVEEEWEGDIKKEDEKVKFQPVLIS